MLSKNPVARPSIGEVLAHPFITGQKATRLPGDEPDYDVFISYRVASDAHHAKILFELLTFAGVRVWCVLLSDFLSLSLINLISKVGQALLAAWSVMGRRLL
jgi:hypothetical protein